MERVIAYIDGFNLYFGLKEKNWKRYYWLNLQKLITNIIRPRQKLVETKYFTARVIRSKGESKRQKKYLRALETLSDFGIYFGKYQLNPRVCHNCKYKDFVPSEKMTDVNIAVEMLSDAFQDKFDLAMLVSADSDLSPVIRSIKDLFPQKRVIAAFPPGRNSVELQECVDATLKIFRRTLAKSTFPRKVISAKGQALYCPKKWS